MAFIDGIPKWTSDSDTYFDPSVPGYKAAIAKYKQSLAEYDEALTRALVDRDAYKATLQELVESGAVESSEVRAIAIKHRQRVQQKHGIS